MHSNPAPRAQSSSPPLPAKKAASFPPSGKSAVPSSGMLYSGHQRLAAGAMGIVFRVLDRNTGEHRALKRLSSEGAKERSLVEAFEREYHVLAGLAHPRIIRVFDYGIDDEGPYYTM